MKKVTSFLFLLLTFPQITYTDTHQIFKNIEDKNLIDFNKIFKKICNTEKFFKNLVSHSSYPNFGSSKDWKKICVEINEKKIAENHLVKNNFKIKTLSSIYGKLTGYYEPEINVSKTKTSHYSIPILKFKKKFLGIKRNLINETFIENDVLLWTDDIVDFFFLQIQGSGIGVFDNGGKIKILYGGNNNLKYTSIGKVLLKRKLLDQKKVNLFTIKKFLRQNPKKIDSILNENHRYIFFKTSINNKKNPKGAFGINLIPNVSIAVDKKHYPLGIPLLYKEAKSQTYKPTFAIDTGSAIVGKNRADLFTGNGKTAEKNAGMLKKKLLLYVLVPYSE